MVLEEFELLIQIADKQLGKKVVIERADDGTWSCIKDGPPSEDLRKGTLTAVMKQLQKWATPPKPETVTITIPFDTALWSASFATRIEHEESKAIINACRKAIEPWLPSK